MLARSLIQNRFLSLILIAIFANSLYGFSFSEAEAEDGMQSEARAELIRQLQSAQCSKRLKNKKIAVIIGERRQGSVSMYSKSKEIANYINRSLKKLGLRTYTQSQIRQQIASAETKAYLNGDTDGALNAARRLAANFMLKGVVSVVSGVNKVVGVNEVSVRMNFTLQNSRGRVISSAEAEDQSYAGSDTYSVALDLAKEQGEVVVAKLYNEYCNRAR